MESRETMSKRPLGRDPYGSRYTIEHDTTGRIVQLSDPNRPPRRAELDGGQKTQANDDARKATTGTSMTSSGRPNERTERINERTNDFGRPPADKANNGRQRINEQRQAPSG
uniref:Uncharacterized protein n=1 Tax=Plectus sambesii TaxID=2011161 RepID=A0A914X315_9BILA